IVFPAHGGVPSSSPTTTGPVVAVIETGPSIVELQTRIAAAPDALSGPLIVAPCTTRVPPACTVKGPLIVAPGGIRADRPEPTVNGPLFATCTVNEVVAPFPARSVA